jgi:MerR family transcriptional regulator/heat shock protein HspR
MILKLTRELGVNLAGVETILNMREEMQAMQKQIQCFVEALDQELSHRAARRPMENNSLMPVIQMGATRAQGKRTPEGKRKVR